MVVMRRSGRPAISSTQQTFASEADHRRWLTEHAQLPRGFRTGTARFEFVPEETPRQAKMTLTIPGLKHDVSCDGEIRLQ